MTSQPRSPSIPIPRSTTAAQPPPTTSPSRDRTSLDSYLSIPLSLSPVRSPSARPRLPPSRSVSASGATGAWGIPGAARRASASASASASATMAIPGLSPTRSTARSFTLSSASSSSSQMTHRGSPRSHQQPTFEPRVIRADSTSNNNTVDPACLPSSSTSPTRTRRQSGAGPGGRAPSTSRAGTTPTPSSSSTSTPNHTHLPTPNPSQTAFPRPAYLAHSALRHLLQTESPPSLPQRSTGAGSGELHAYLVRNRRGTITSATMAGGRGRGRDSVSPPDLEDSDEDSSNVSPPPSRSSHRAQMRGVSASSSSGAGGRGAGAGEGVEYGEVMKLPTRWSQEVRFPSLSVSSDGRELTFNGPSSNGDKEAAAARTDHAIPPACGIFYYEVEILSKGQKGHISIGFAAGDVKLSRLPGWEKNSWGYHGDDGFSFSAEKNGTSYGPKFGTGDIIGCGVDFSQNRAFYTKDGAFLGSVFDRVGSTTPIYPSVGLRHNGEAIRVNFGHEPFKFNIEDHVLQARNVTWAAIMNTPLRREFITSAPSGAGDTDTKPDVRATDVAAAMGSENKGPINQLVLSYLSHHGYAKTARAFRAQCERRGGLGGDVASGDSGVAPLPVPALTSTSPPHENVDVDMEMDLTPTSKTPSRSLSTTTTATAAAPTFDGWGPGTHPNDIELRTRIVNSVIEGDIDTALNETARWHPKVLEREEGLMLFKLRCRKFVELILEAAELKKRMKREAGACAGVGEGKSGIDGVDGMDVDEGDLEDGVNGFRGSGGSSAIPIKAKRKHSISHSDWTSAAAAVQYESALNSAISYGQTLQSDYKTDSRPEVRAIFNRTFGVVAYEDPLEAGGDVAEVAGQEARMALATELNQDILQSQGRPAHPILERLYRQTAACIVQLGLLGVGAAAFADMPKEFLDVDA